MAIHKLMIDDFVSVDFELIAIHSSLEDYRLAYFINRELGILLEKSDDNIGIKITEGETSFSRFVFEDTANDIMWSLIQNKNQVTSTGTDTTTLFDGNGYTITTNVFLLPELKKVDYILKIENTPADFGLNELTDSLLAVKHITTAYTIDHNKLKSKNNLIF
jgi:hypothetical protein